MKVLFTLLLTFFLTISYSQSNLKEIVIVSCESGELIVDGTSKGMLDAEDAHKVLLLEGEHYLQVKTKSSKFSNTITVGADKISKIFRIGCEENNGQKGLVRVLDKKLTLIGLLSQHPELNYFGLDEGDELIINSAVLAKSGNANISIRQFETGYEIYRKSEYSRLEGEIVIIPKKGIYSIQLSTNALFGKDANITIDRKPSPTSSSSFKTTVHLVKDTIPIEVLNTKNRVYSQLNDRGNKSVVKVNLPTNTIYFAYWIGVGSEASNSFKTFTTSLTSVLTSFSTNPLVLFGLKMIPSLPMLNSTSTVSYRFMDSPNAQAFTYNKPYSYFQFKQATNISTDYSLINVVPQDLVLGLWNESPMVGQDVDIKVVAFTVNQRLVMDN